MSDETSAVLALPYIQPAQAQKHVTHNEALRLLDLLVQLGVASRSQTAPPPAPAPGTRHIVPAGGSGAFAGQAGRIALYEATGWAFVAAQAGWRAHVLDEGVTVTFDGSAWTGPAQTVQRFAGVGINATADTANRLTVAAPGTLLNHAGAGHQLRINKAAAGQTASLLFQTGFSGRAEMGLAGSDDFEVKVSPDGTTFLTGLSLNRSSGRVSLPAGQAHPESGQLLAQLIPCTVVREIWRADVSRPATARTYTLSAVSGTTLTLTTADVAAIFSVGMRSVAMVRIWNTSKSPAQPAWVTWDLSTTQMTVSNAAHVAGWLSGETLRLGDPNPTGSNVLGMVALDISPYMVANFGTAFRQRGVLLATYAAGTGGDVAISGSGSGASGSAIGANSLSGGTRSFGSITLFTPEASPVSTSNLVFFREELGAGATAMGITYLRLQAVYV